MLCVRLSDYWPEGDPPGDKGVAEVVPTRSEAGRLGEGENESDRDIKVDEQNMMGLMGWPGRED